MEISSIQRRLESHGRMMKVPKNNTDSEIINTSFPDKAAESQ